MAEIHEYKPSKEIDALIPFDNRRSEVTRRAKLRTMVHDHAVANSLTIRTEIKGGAYLKNQLDAGHPEWQSLQLTLKFMNNRPKND